MSVTKLEGDRHGLNPKEATGCEMAGAMASYLNVIGDGDRIKDFVAHMGIEHRTLQQGFTRLVVAWLQDLAKQDHFDPRNEASVMLARKLLDGKAEHELHLPLI